MCMKEEGGVLSILFLKIRAPCIEVSRHTDALYYRDCSFTGVWGGWLWEYKNTLF